MNIPIATPIAIAAPPSSAMRAPRQSIGRRENRALIIPTMNNEITERVTDIISATLEINMMYGTSGIREASTQDTNIKIAEIIEGRSLTFE